MRPLLIASFILAADVGSAGSLTTTHAIRPNTIITADDIVELDTQMPGTIVDTDALIGKEAKVTLYPGRPIQKTDIGPPALIERNQYVALKFLSGNIEIRTEGRALGRAAFGEYIRVINVDSRSTVTGQVAADGTVTVSSSNLQGN